jgi:transmembrane sensor
VSIGALGAWREFATRSLHRDSSSPFRATFSTGRGERATVDLQDGSRVFLAPETELRVAAVGRQVYLNGEAVFHVVHDSSNPFRVFARGVVVRDVGTQFDMRAYFVERTMRVAVAEGSVSLGSSKPAPSAAPPVVLARGAIGIVDDSTGATSVTQDSSVDRYLAWADGRLTFTNARMAEVIPEIRRWYNYDVRLGDPRLADERLTVTLDNIPPDVALEMIARALAAHIVRKGSSVLLYSKTRESAHE